MANVSLLKIGSKCICTGVVLSILLSPQLTKAEVNYTEADLVNNPIYLEELTKIEEDYTINFQNKELYKIIENQLGKKITVKDLRDIKTLEINKLSDTNLNDLKYLINLESLTILENEINLSDLKYNKNLKTLALMGCTLTNTKDLPNSIEKIEYTLSDIKDKTLTVPFNTYQLAINDTLFSNIHLKNPTNLTYLSFTGYSILDLEVFKECSNLLKCEFKYCPNIKNGNILTTLQNLEMLVLDDYTSIWLDTESLRNLNCIDENNKEDILKKSKELDKIAHSLVPFEMSEEDKVRSIVLNIASRLEYDTSALDDSELAKSLSNEYNRLPITYALQGEGVCINYACLFTALANRVGLTNYQNFSETHTWNIIKENDEYNAYDVTNMDSKEALLKDNSSTPIIDEDHTYQYYFDINNEECLYYYDFEPSKINNTTFRSVIYSPTELENTDIGYVEDLTIKSPLQKIDIRINMAKKLLPLIPVAFVMEVLDIILAKKKKKTKVLRKS